MAKLTLSDPAVLSDSLPSTISANNALIETALENTLSRDGTSPNSMSASLDMNSNRIINLPAPVSAHEPLRLVDITGLEVTVFSDNSLSILEFIPTAEHAAIIAGTSTTDLADYLEEARAQLAAAATPPALVFPAGQYTTSISPNWGISNLHIVTLGEVIWNYTGTGNAFIVDAGASPANGITGLNIGRFVIKGSSNTTNGAFYRGIHHSTIEGPTVIGAGAASAGILTQFCVLSQWNKPIVSNNQYGGFVSAPIHGLRIDDRDAPEETSYSLFINSILEGVEVGCFLQGALGNVFIGGAMEGCSSQGALLDTDARYNKFIGVDFESNTQDIYCAGDNNSFLDCDTQTIIICDASSSSNIISGGVHYDIRFDASSVGNQASLLRYNWSGLGGTITDNGTNSLVFMNYNPSTGAWSTITTAHITNDAVTNAKRANMAETTISGRAVGAGTGDPTDLTSAQAAAVVMANGQLPFPAVQNPSADANTLDDYEEGTWTPVLSFVTPGDVAVTYSLQSGTYTKIGRLVHVQCSVVTSAFTHTTASGNLAINGLPFAASAALHRGAVQLGGFTQAGYTNFNCSVGGASTVMQFSKSGSGVASSAITTADMPTGGTVTIIATISYTV